MFTFVLNTRASIYAVHIEHFCSKAFNARLRASLSPLELFSQLILTPLAGRAVSKAKSRRCPQHSLRVL